MTALGPGFARHATGNYDRRRRSKNSSERSSNGSSRGSSSSSSSSSICHGLMFGDPRARAPYGRRDRRRLDQVIEQLRASTSGSALADCYAANVPIEVALPELAALLSPLGQGLVDRFGPLFGPAVPGTPALYLGAGGQRTPLHFDPTENLTAVMQGSKHFRLFPPAASLQLQPRGGYLAAAACWLSGVVPAVYSDVDAWRSHGSPRPLDVEVRAGEVLYLPPGWWHAVAGSQAPNVTLVFGFAPGISKGARYFRRLLPI